MPPKIEFEGPIAALLDGTSRATLEREVLPPYLEVQRWFGGKSRALLGAEVEDWAEFGDLVEPACLIWVRARFDSGEHDLYLVPIAFLDERRHAASPPIPPHAVLAEVSAGARRGLLVDATLSDPFCLRLLELVSSGREAATLDGVVLGTPTLAFGPLGGSSPVASIRRGSVEQSNTTIFYDNRLLLKLFRRVVAGQNPDFEIGRFLTERSSHARVPRTAGALEYRRAGRSEPSTLAIVQELVANQGQGWMWVLEVAREFLRSAEARSIEAVDMSAPVEHPYLASAREIPLGVQDRIGEILPTSRLLGRRTGELHLALAGDPTDPQFSAEPLSTPDIAALGERVRRQADQTLASLRHERPEMRGELAGLVDRVIAVVPGLARRAGTVAAGSAGMVKIRCHGDYHFGQVLRTDGDFVILDFEGEPLRDLTERRAKQSPLRDVAGMLRSLEYAAFSALTTHCQERPLMLERLGPWADLWRAWASVAFLAGYRAVASDSLLPRDDLVACRLLDDLMLEKLLFEVRYELDYRPDWTRIPLLGILRLGGSP